MYDSTLSSITTKLPKTPQIVEMPTEKWAPNNETDKKLLPAMSIDGNWDFQIAGGNKMDRFVVEKINKTTVSI